MRTIKFRGKIVGTDNKEFDGKWVYGDLSRVNAQRIIWDESKRYDRGFFVEESTIGQYTGLKDAHKVEIYEGDILFLEDDEVPFGSVAWHPDGYFAIDRHFGKYDFSKFKCRPLGEMLNRELDNGMILRFVVNGNIYE